MSSTFAVTIFLSLTLLFTKQDASYDLLEKLLWSASGLFFAASMRLIDKIFDHSGQFKVVMAIMVVNGKSFISIDDRWKDGRFTLYFFGWVFFLFAFFYVGISLFYDVFPTSIIQACNAIFSSYWLGSFFLMMMWATISSVTREFFFKN